MYIQALLHRFNTGFNSIEYQYANDGHGPEFDYFIEHCTLQYIRSLHLKQPFSITSAFDYSERPWERDGE